MSQEIKITTRDKLLRAWENTKELVRDFECYSKEVDDEKVRSVFKKLAEDECMHASELQKVLIEYQEREGK